MCTRVIGRSLPGSNPPLMCGRVSEPAFGAPLARLIRSGRLVVDPVRMGLAAASTRREVPGAARHAYVDALLHLAALSIVAGAIHAVVAPPHFAEAWTYGTFFVALAVFQLAWSAWIYARPSALGFRIGAAVSLVVIGIWILSRTAGMPFGPEPWQAEPVGAPDLAATAGEVLIAVLCGAFLASAGVRPSARWLPAPFRGLHPVAMAVMLCGLLSLLLGGGHHTH
jgi:hypothetical protein